MIGPVVILAMIGGYALVLGIAWALVWAHGRRETRALGGVDQ